MTFLLSFIEIFFILMIYNLIFNLKLRKNSLKFVILAFGGAFTYFLVSSVLDINKLFTSVVVTVLISVIASKIDEKENIDGIIEMIIASIILLSLELIMMVILDVIIPNEDVTYEIYLISLVLAMAIILYFIDKIIIRFKLNFHNKVSDYSNINIVILNALIFFLFVKLFAIYNLFSMEILIQIIILLLLLVFVNVYFLISYNKKKHREKRLEINSNLNPLIEDLMKKMKANEHEYNNHLNVIYAMIQVCKEDELKSRAKAYIGDIITKNDILYKLADIENTIVKAVLYKKIPEAEAYDINIQYEVDNNLKGIPLDDSELAVVISNLVNNAIESTKHINDKEIDIYLGKVNDKYVIEISNTIDPNSYIDVRKICKQGFSTKGNERGYGLYNVKSIIEKYKGNMEIEVVDNRILFIMEI